jgi:hypothetical protein
VKARFARGCVPSEAHRLGGEYQEEKMTSHADYAVHHTESLVDKFLATLAAFFSRLDSGGREKRG